MSKKIKSQEIYDLFTKAEPDPKKLRPLVIKDFIDKLDMTPAGAATYYANCKRKANGGKFNTSTTPEPKTEKRSDGRTLYTICTSRNDEELGIVVDSTSSHYDIKDAKKRCKKGQVVVKGLPEIDSHFDKLKAVA